MCQVRHSSSVPLSSGIPPAGVPGVWRVDLPTPRRSDDAAVPPARACQQRAFAGTCWGLSHRCPDGGGFVRERLLTEDEATRLLTFCNNSNPVFLISVLGVGVFGSVRAGVWLWLIHLLSALLVGMLFRGGSSAPRQRSSPSFSCRSVSLAGAFVDAVKGAATSMLAVCGFITLFYVLARPFAALGGYLAPALVGLVELFSLTPLLPADRLGFILAAALSGWGGLSVLAQTAAVLDGTGLPLRRCLVGKASQCLLSALLAALLSSYALS